MRITRALPLLTLAALTLPMRSHIGAPALPARLQSLPRITVWAWERREDLTPLQGQPVAVAQLVETLIQEGEILRVQPQRNAIRVPAGTVRIAVVRIETHHATLSETTANTIAAELANVAQLPGAAMLQVDFDATQSERGWYRSILQQLRTQMPPHQPLSITALASWCSADRWIHTLPVDEAVPMLFRMEPGERSDYNIPIREPLCARSTGVSTHEGRPRDLAGKRIYVFADAGWHTDDLTTTLRTLP